MSLSSYTHLTLQDSVGGKNQVHTLQFCLQADVAFVLTLLCLQCTELAFVRRLLRWRHHLESGSPSWLLSLLLWLPLGGFWSTWRNVVHTSFFFYLSPVCSPTLITLALQGLYSAWEGLKILKVWKPTSRAWKISEKLMQYWDIAGNSVLTTIVPLSDLAVPDAQVLDWKMWLFSTYSGCPCFTPPTSCLSPVAVGSFDSSLFFLS